MRKKLTAMIVALMTAAFVPQGHAAGPDHVDITWMSIANIHYQMGSVGVLTDGYITRIPESEFHGDVVAPDRRADHRLADNLFRSDGGEPAGRALQAGLRSGKN